MKRSGAIDGTGSSSSGGERSVDEEENWGSVPADVTQPLAGAIKGFKSSSAAGRRCDDDAPPPATGPKVSKVVSFNRPHPASPDNIPRDDDIAPRSSSAHSSGDSLGSPRPDGPGTGCSPYSFIDDPMPTTDNIIRTTSDEGIVMEHWEVMNGVRMPPRRGKIIMVENILEVIQSSVRDFRPSKSLGLLVANETTDEGMDIEAPAAEIDLVVSGGGLKGYYGVGAVHVLLRHLSAHNIGVRRVAGTSAGAWVAFFILTGMSVANWLETYYALQRNPEAKIVDVYREVWHAWMKHTIPEDTYKTCSGRLFITTTIITPWGLRECCTSTFASNDEIFDACCASSQIPYVTAAQFCAKFKGLYHLDGGIVNNCPVFTDGVRRQLVVKLMDVEYPFRLLVSANDTCIEALAIRGGLVMKQFLEGGVHSESLAWVQAKDEKQSLSWRLRGRFFRNMVITPVALIIIILYRGSGLRDLRYSLMGISKEAKLGESLSEIVPLDGTRDIFSTNTFSYVVTTVASTVAKGLQSLGWLM